MDSSIRRSALVSSNGVYRYTLERLWSGGGVDPLRMATFVMINPSTADAYTDDPTIRRCMRFAERFECNALRVVNLYAFRSPDPGMLAFADDPVGPLNPGHLIQAIVTARANEWPLIVAWGREQAGLFRVELEQQGAKAQCLGQTKAGHPRHPLYVRADAELQGWS